MGLALDEPAGFLLRPGIATADCSHEAEDGATLLSKPPTGEVQIAF